MTTQRIYIVQAYFRSPDGQYSFHEGETLTRDELVQRGLLVPAEPGSTELVETEAMKQQLWRNALRIQEEDAAPPAPADVAALLGEGPVATSAPEPEAPPEA